MKLPLLAVCLLMSVTLWGTSEDNTTNLQKALACGQQKNDNEIVIFHLQNTQETNSCGKDQNLRKKLYAYCQANPTVVLLDNLDENTCSVNGKTTIYMIRRLNFPVNHNDGDLYHIYGAIKKLKDEQKQIPFIIATTEEGRENLRSYLSRQYPNDVLVSFPEKSFNLFDTPPLVIVGGAFAGTVAILGFFYFCFRMGIYYEASKRG